MESWDGVLVGLRRQKNHCCDTEFARANEMDAVHSLRLSVTKFIGMIRVTAGSGVNANKLGLTLDVKDPIENDHLEAFETGIC